MTATLARRFVIAPPPSPLAWLAESLNRAFRCPTEPLEAQERLIERLLKPR